MKLKNEKLIKDWEQLRLEAYLPTPNDVWTIGWGHTKTARPGMKITREQAQTLFELDTAWVQKAMEKYVKVPLTQNQYDATFSFVFNIGETNFARSTFLRKLNNKDYEGAANEFPRWNKQKGKVLRGLVRRRAHEQELFMSSMASKAPANGTGTEGPAPLKGLKWSKELWGGILASLSGVKGLLGSQVAENGLDPSSVLFGALIVVGVILVINRLKARKDGDR